MTNEKTEGGKKGLNFFELSKVRNFLKCIPQEIGTEYAKCGHKIAKITKNTSLLTIKM